MANLTERGRMVLGKLLAAEKAGPLPDVDKEILADLKQAAGILSDDGPTAGDYGKAALETAGEAITLPGRAARGLALGITEGGGEKEKTAEAMIRGFLPSYQPKTTREAVVGTIGGVAGDVATLGVGRQLLKAPKLAGPVSRILRGGAEGAALSAGSAAAEGADVKEVAKAAGLGAAGGAAGTGVAEGLGYGARALGGLLQGQASSGVGENVLSKVAGSADELRGNLGSPKNVTKAAKSVITKSERARGNAGKLVGKIRKDLGLPDRREQAMVEFLDDTAQSADELAASIRARVKSGGPVGAPPEQILRYLDTLKHDLDKLIGWSKIRSTGGGADKIATLDQAALIDLRGQMKDAIAALPLPAAKALSKAEEVFSKKADAYATLLGSIKTEGGAEALLKNLAGSGPATAGKLADAQRAAKSLGLSRTLTKATKEAAAALVKTAPKPSGPMQNLLRATGPAGLAKTFSAGKSVEAAGKALPGSKAAVVVGKNLAEALKRRRSE